MLPTATVIERVLIDALDRLEGSVVIDEPDWVQLKTPSSSHSHHNVVSIARLDPRKAEARVHEVLEEYRSLDVHFRWVVGPSSRPDTLPTLLEAAGLRLIGVGAGMFMEIPAGAPKLMAGLEIRPATPEDVDAYTELTVRGADRGQQFADAARSAFMAAMGCEDRSFWVAFLGAALVGTATLRLLPGPAAGLGYFQGATVDESYRRRGVYRALCLHRLDLLRRMGIRYAVVWADESTSAPGCEKLGFRRVCRAHFYET